MTAAIFEITKAAGFDAAHRLPGGPAQGPATGPVGWVADLGDLDGALKSVCAELDHSLLNDHEGLASPTLEALCQFFAARLKDSFPGLSRVVVSRPTVGERCALDLA
jgi:6-pyruvoyltetrahydropterin/6-carboxytetrahydropterin synthase